jgi:integrase
VWLYRWREVDPKGKPQMRSLVVGTVKDYKTESAAWMAVETLRLNVNQEALRPDAVALTLKQAVEHYRAIELNVEVESERKTFKTKQVYDSNLQTHIEPRWGEYRLRDITAVAVERWLERLEMAGSSKAKLKYVMSDVYQHAIRYGWLRNDENPLLAVRQSAKREQVPETLEAHEFRALMLKLPQKLRTMGIICATTGLRISEVLGLKWSDIDWKKLEMKVSRSVVYARVGKCKTEVSRQPVPLDGLTVEELSKWHEACTYGQPSDWIFASEWVGGKMPPWANTLLTRFIRPAAKEAKITKRIGWHTFRHTYSTLLKGNGEDVKVVQELMRHATFQTTMNVYTRAITTAKRDAQSRVVDVLMDRPKPVKVRRKKVAA